MQHSKRLSFMDFSAIISSFAVVTLHSAGGNLDFSNFSISALLTILINIVFSFGVPMFFMQSGANVLNYRQRYSTKVYWQKRISKVIVPFLIWSIIGYGFVVFTGSNGGKASVGDFIIKLVGSQIMGPYWFFYNIIAFYICVPFLAVLMDNITRRMAQYFIAVVVAVNAIFIPLMGLFQVGNGYAGNVFPVIGGYLEYYLIGPGFKIEVQH